MSVDATTILRRLTGVVPTGSQGMVEDIPLPQVQLLKSSCEGAELVIYSSSDDSRFHQQLVESSIAAVKQYGAVNVADRVEAYARDAPHRRFYATRLAVGRNA